MAVQRLDINEQIKRIYTRIKSILTFTEKENSRFASFSKIEQHYDSFMATSRLDAVLEETAEGKW